MNDANANHVVQKLVEVLTFDKLEFIVVVLERNIFNWATHIYGCRIIQKFIEYFPIEKNRNIIELVFNNLFDICQDLYGNYVIQHIIEFSTDHYKDRFYTAVHGSLIRLSCHKFASNVIEKALQHASQERLRVAAEEIFSSEPEVLMKTMSDKYGNYVIQKAIETSRGDLQKMIVSTIMKFEARLKEFVCGKHILACIDKYAKN